MSDNVAIDGEETVPVTIVLNMPRKVTLPVPIDPLTGDAWPSAGIHLARVFNAPDLIAAGIEVEWRKEDGTVIPADIAMELIKAHTKMVQDGHAVPNFLPVQGDKT